MKESRKNKCFLIFSLIDTAAFFTFFPLHMFPFLSVIGIHIFQ